MITLDNPIASLGRMRNQTIHALSVLGITSVEDFLYHIPRRFLDFRSTRSIESLRAGETVSILGSVVSIRTVYTKTGKRFQQAVVTDKTGTIDLIWFNQPYLLAAIAPGKQYGFAGTVNPFGKRLSILSAEYEEIPPNLNQNAVHTGRLVPIYPLTEGISSKTIRNHIHRLIFEINPAFEDFLPPLILHQFSLIPLKEAFTLCHFPNSYEEYDAGKRRLAFNELLTLRIASSIRKQIRLKEKSAIRIQLNQIRPVIQKTISNLPFKLTPDQITSLETILNDLSKSYPMNHLLMGDVGSGKTIVAILASLAVVHMKRKVLVMAPTQILATQHFATFNRFLKDYKIQIELVTSESKKKRVNKQSHIYIGTHALLSRLETHTDIGLVIIDEEQRFGVQQRSALKKKHGYPHFLTMTATPIPRTIAKTLYDDVDLSELSTLPDNRMLVKTWVVPAHKRTAAYGWINSRIENPQRFGYERKPQVFIVCPFIDPSESTQTVTAASAEYKRIKTSIFPHLTVNLLHGRMKEEEKQHVLSDFATGKSDVLVATPVVEVGIDIPNASFMIIEAADRFGLSQLHQLRGRVGRGGLKAYCLLFSDLETPETLIRLKLLETIYNGPQLAKHDLAIRGPGELFGTKQHGRWSIKIADFRDDALIDMAGSCAEIIYKNYSNLLNEAYLREKLSKYIIESKAD